MNGVGTRKRLGKSSSRCKKIVLWEVVEMPFDHRCALAPSVARTPPNVI